MVSIDNYIKVLAKVCVNVYEEMAQVDVTAHEISKYDQPFPRSGYKTAIVIPYENKEEQFEGKFILGFNETAMAVELASAIAANAGMEPVVALDDTATDILFEFMNTVAGKIITSWDELGLSADFAPPEFILDLSFENADQDNISIHTVTLTTAKGHLTLLIYFEEMDSSPFKNKKVLVVDDSRMIRFMLAKEFEAKGCQVLQAQNGLEAVMLAKENQPDLIIMDLIMPKVGGLKATSMIREFFPKLPVIVLTSTSKKEEVIQAAALKVAGYIKKPIKMKQIVDLAERCLGSAN